MPDTYTEAFYTFERFARARFEPADPRDFTMRECVDLALEAFAAVGMPSHPFVFSNEHPDGKTAGACTRCEEVVETEDGSATMVTMFVLCFPAGRRRPWCVLHECAHAAMWNDGHGPMFARVCIDLWVQFVGWDRDALMDLATQSGVAVGLQS